MILFYGLPPQIYHHGGMIRRMAYIDSLFSNEERVYIYPYQQSQRTYEAIPKLEKISDLVSFLPLCFSDSIHNDLFVSLLRKCDFLYAHTVHSGQFLYPYYDSGKIVSDLHGIAPEEEAMHGNVNRARFYAAFEKTLIQKSYRIIGVTRAMLKHYQEKYGICAERFICLPIAPSIEPVKQKKSNNATRIIYSGGAQEWQRVPQMLDMAKQLGTDFEFLFLTPDEDAVRQLAEKKGVSDLIKIHSCLEFELPKYYAWADYGLCLREDSPVNRVACPTKLVEYAVCGVVPIVESTQIGDFFEAGGQGVKLDDLLQKKYPTQESIEAMRQANYAAMECLSGDVKQGAAMLCDMPLPVSPISDVEWEFRFYTSKSRTEIFPATGCWHYGSMSKAEPDICSFHHEASFTLPGYEHDVLYSLAPLPVLLDAPSAFATYADGSKKEVPCIHNFVISNGSLAARPGKSTITIAKKNLQKAVVVSIVINILAMDTHIALTTSEKRRRFADKILPIGTKRRALVKKVLFALKIIKNS